MFLPHVLCYVCWFRWIIKLCLIVIDIYYGIFEIDVELCFIYILLISYKIILACSFRLSVALYHVGHVVWCDSKREFSRKMVGFVSLDDYLEWQKHESRECTVATKENKMVLVTTCFFYCLIYTLFLIQSSVALSLWLCRGSQLSTKGCMLDSPLWWINDLLYFFVLPTQLNRLFSCCIISIAVLL